MKVPILKMMLLCLLIGGSGNDCWGQEQTATKEFTINEQTGEVSNCSLIKLIGKEKQAERTNNQVDSKIKKNLYKKIKKKGDDLFTISTIDKKHFICLDASHGGYLNALYFFDKNLKLLNKYVFENTQILDVEFNSSKTFINVHSPFNGNFYFFTLKGQLTIKGNFNDLTNDKGTSYGKPDITKDGNFYLLNNNDSYILSNTGTLVDKIIGGATSSYIDDNKGKIYMAINEHLVIYNYINKKIEYVTQEPLKSLHISNNSIFLKLNNQRYEYTVN